MAAESNPAKTRRATRRPAGAEELVNQVTLRGRLAAAPLIRELPSGDELCQFRLIVPRPEGEPIRVDSIDCVVANARVRRTLLAAEPQDELQIEGSLHRRFWRATAGIASRYEVRVSSAKSSRRRRSDASPAQTQASA